MPLPDERPRQSVANLIGRFENQNKRPAPANGSPLRSPSVVSHSTGDSLNHERREWPPRSVSERIASLECSTPRPRATLPPSQSAPQPTTAPMVLEPSEPTVPPAVPVIEAPSTVEAQADEHKAAAPVPAPPPAPTPPRSPSMSSKPVARTISKSTSARHSPIMPQHTGLFTASTASTRRQAISPTPTKTPIRSASARPKTPSSGLHAPTAASLAKSRSAQAASGSTTPARKSASASDRLSKPTAASMSRARTPAPPVALPSRPNMRSVASPAKVIKPKAACSLAKKSPPAKMPTTAGTDVQPEAVDDKDPINGHSAEEHVEDACPSEEVTEQGKEHTESDVHGTDVCPESDADASTEMANEGTPTEVGIAPSLSIVKGSQNIEQDFSIDQGDDIEFMVKILESVTIPQARPASIATIPDEVHEIPDEE